MDTTPSAHDIAHGHEFFGDLITCVSSDKRKNVEELKRAYEETSTRYTNVERDIKTLRTYREGMNKILKKRGNDDVAYKLLQQGYNGVVPNIESLCENEPRKIILEMII